MSATVREQLPDHAFRTEIPNIIFEMLEQEILKNQDFIVYCVLKKISGDHGSCTYSMENLAKKCSVGQTALRESLKRLKEIFSLAGNTLIQVIERQGYHGSDISNEIIIIDIWRANGNHFREKYKLKKSIPPSPGEPPPYQNPNPPPSPGEPNKEPYKEEPYKEKQSLPLTPSSVVAGEEERRRERVSASSLSLEKKMQALEESMKTLEVTLEDSKGQQVQIGQSTKEMIARNHTPEEIEGALNYLCNCYYDNGKCPDYPIAIIQKALREGLKGLSDSEKQCVAYIQIFKNNHREINLIIYETYVKEPETQKDLVFSGMSFDSFKRKFHEIWRV